jgi:hypothetical protein
MLIPARTHTTRFANVKFEPCLAAKGSSAARNEQLGFRWLKNKVEAVPPNNHDVTS